jgi:streptogramin lyase
MKHTVAKFLQDCRLERLSRLRLIRGLRPALTPYGVGVDRNDFVWYASYDNYTLGRLDPSTGKVLEYPLPYSGNGIREILQDVDGRMWFGTSFNNKVGYFISPEGLKSNQCTYMSSL